MEYRTTKCGVGWGAPKIEGLTPHRSYLFRGVLLRGFAASWGFAASAIIVSTVFVLSHAPEFVHYWPGAGAISGLAVGTLVARRVSGSLVPAVALHVSYNAVMIVALYSMSVP